MLFTSGLYCLATNYIEGKDCYTDDKYKDPIKG